MEKRKIYRITAINSIFSYCKFTLNFNTFFGHWFLIFLEYLNVFFFFWTRKKKRFWEHVHQPSVCTYGCYSILYLLSADERASCTRSVHVILFLKGDAFIIYVYVVKSFFFSLKVHYIHYIWNIVGL